MHRSLKLEEARRLARENIKDIIACGFDPDMTFIFSDIDHMGAGGSEGSAFYCNCLRVMRCESAIAGRTLHGLPGSSANALCAQCNSVQPNHNRVFDGLLDSYALCLQHIKSSNSERCFMAFTLAAKLCTKRATLRAATLSDVCRAA